MLYLEKLLIKKLIYNHVNKDKVKRRKQRLKNKKQQVKRSNIKVYGKMRYYLAWWFGPWILYAFRRENT